jgi:mannosyl-3-phosphoglycerate phosphatase
MPEAVTPGNSPRGAAKPVMVVFTDLDGTLLDHDTYDAEAARPSLDRLAARGAIVVLASSKTRAEIDVWRERLGLGGPFICENGGALHIPERLRGSWPGAQRDDFGWFVPLGTPYDELRRALPDLAGTIGARFTGFGDLDEAAIAAATGLTLAEAALAKRREWDEPFTVDRALSDSDTRALSRSAEARGLRVTRGGRFHHLTGPVNKGEAARRFLAGLDTAGRVVRTLGVGDGPNDLDLLNVVERPVVVARPDGSHAPELVAALPDAVFTHAPGPRGFTEAVTTFLAQG